MSYTSKCKIRNVSEEYSNTTFVENQLLKFFKYLYFFFAFFKVIHDFPSLKIFELLSFKVLWNGNGIRFQSKLERLYKLWKLEVSHWIAQHVHADIIVNSLHGVCICNRRYFKKNLGNVLHTLSPPFTGYFGFGLILLHWHINKSTLYVVFWVKIHF